MIKKTYNILPELNGEIINFVTNSSSKIYRDNTLVSDFPIGDFSIYTNSIDYGFYITEGECDFAGVSYFLDEDYTVTTSNLGDCIKFDSSNKTKLSLVSPTDYNTITLLLELTNVYNYLFFVWNDKWDILYKEDVSRPGEVWSGNIKEGYYVLYLDTSTPPTTTIEYGDGESDVYSESLIIFYTKGETTITLSGSGMLTIYLRSLDINETISKTTSDGLYVYSKKTKLGPFKLPINTPCVLDFEYFSESNDTNIYIYCNYFLIGSGKLYEFNLNKNKSINFNMTSVNVSSTILSSNIYSLGLFTSKKASPASVYDICCRSISSPVVKTNMYNDDNLYIYKTDYSVWVLDYYNNTVMVLYGDELKKSTISSLYNNLMYSHDNYNTTSYGFSLSEYKIVDVLYNKGIFILLLEDRIVIIDKFGTVLRYIYCKNISKLFYIDNYVLFYDKTRARLYRVYSNDFKNFELPSVLMDIDFGTKFKLCQLAGPFAVVDGDYVSIVKENSVFGYRPLYDYFDVRTYTVGSHTESNVVFEYDLIQNATKFTGIMTALGYKVFGNNPIEDGFTSFTLFVSIKPMSLEFKRYILRIPGTLDVYMIDGKLKVDLKCVNDDVSVECLQLFNVNVWYDIIITYHSSTGLYIYINGSGSGKEEFNYNTGGTIGQSYVVVGGYSADSYAAYKFKGFIRDSLFITRSFVNEHVVLNLYSNSVRDSKTFSEYNNYVSVYGVTDLVNRDGYVFVGTYDGLYVYDIVTFDIVNVFGGGNIVVSIDLSLDFLSASLVKLPPIGELSGSSGDVVKISGELYGYIFMASNKACNSCVYNGNTYVELLDQQVSIIDASNYFGTDTIHGYHNLGKFQIDALNTEIQFIGEFGYDEHNNIIVGDTYTNSIYNDKAVSCCGDEWGGTTAYVSDVYTSAILCQAITSKPKYDIFLDVKYLNESITTINLFGVVIDLKYVLLSANPYEYTYTFIVSRSGSIKFPYETVSVSVAEYFASYLSISPCRLYHSENSLLDLSRIKFYFDASYDNLKLLKEKKVKTLENYIETSSRFAYDFRGGLGNGVKHFTNGDDVFGYLDGSSYFVNNDFDDTPIWDFSAEFILRIGSYKEFNPIFSKSTKSELSYGLALYGKDLKFLFGSGGVTSVLDLEVSVSLNRWTFISIYVSDVYIDVLVNGNYSRVLFYGNPDVVESELYVGFGISLNNRAGNFVGDILYFDINKSGSLSSINADYVTYINSGLGDVIYDEIINLDDYYNIEDNVLSMTSAFFSDPEKPISRYFRLYNFYMIGYNSVNEITSVETDSVFSTPFLKRLLKINTSTLDYSLYSFSDFIDFAYDEAGGLYSLSSNKIIQYGLDDITSIDKFKYIITIKYTDDFTLFGTLGGIVKVNNILSNFPTKQYWLLDNGVNSLLVSDNSVYVASSKYLGFVQIEYLKTNLDTTITRNTIPMYAADDIIKSIVKYNLKIYILSGGKIINVTDSVVVYTCGDANSLFVCDNDILIVYDNYIKKLSNEEIILTIIGKITDVSYGDTLAVSCSSGFYLFDEVSDKFVCNSVGVVGILEDFPVFPDYCYHVYVKNNSVIYIYRDIVGIKLVEFNIDNKTIVSSVVLSSLIDGSFSDSTPLTFDSIGN